MGNGFSLKYKPEVTPDPNVVTKFDPNYGFEKPRKERGKIDFLASDENFREIIFVYHFSDGRYRG
jgi:hypothetical protein